MDTPFEQWAGRNGPRDEMYWRGAAIRQFREMVELSDTLQAEGFSPPVVASTHTSKSIDLPVLKMEKPGAGTFLLRDNFHDVNVCFLMERVPSVGPTDLFGEGLTWDWYVAQVERCRNYSYRGWSDAEMDDPRILRVHVKHDLPDTGYWSIRKPDEKDRWLKRWSDPSWYEQDWSRGKVLVEGDMGPGCRFYIASHPFCQGISSVAIAPGATECWSPGTQNFTIETNWKETLPLIRKVFGAVP